MAVDLDLSSTPSSPAGNVPGPPSERRAWLLACATGLGGLAVLLAVLLGLVGEPPGGAPPPIRAVASTPSATPGASFAAVASSQGVRSGALASSPAIVG